MPVVSVSLPKELVSEVDLAIGRLGHKGRSEFMRAAIRDHLLNKPPPSRGHVHGSITIVYPHGKEARVGEIRHHFADVVLSLMHTHCEADTCMDVIIFGGPADRVKALGDTLERMREITRARTCVMA